MNKHSVLRRRLCLLPIVSYWDIEECHSASRRLLGLLVTSAGIKLERTGYMGLKGATPS
jgi:hypothetical protein